MGLAWKEYDEKHDKLYDDIVRQMMNS